MSSIRVKPRMGRVVRMKAKRRVGLPRAVPCAGPGARRSAKREGGRFDQQPLVVTLMTGGTVALAAGVYVTLQLAIVVDPLGSM